MHQCTDSNVCAFISLPPKIRQQHQMKLPLTAVTASAGVPVSADIVLRTSFHSIATWLTSKEAGTTSEAVEGVQDMDTDSAAPSPHLNGHNKRSSDSDDQIAAQDQIIKKVMQELVFHSRAEVSQPIQHGNA